MENIIIEKEGQIGIIMINRPEKLNALNSATIEELHQGFRQLNDDEDVRVILITGSGEKAFVAGADISEFANFSPQQGQELSRKGQKYLFDFVEHLSTPVIALVNGFALGGGLELAMCCHFRIASSNARMGLPEVTLGVIPGYGGTQRLTQLVGKGRAMELIMTAQMIDAETALAFGLVNHVVAPDQLLAVGLSVAQKICSNSPRAISKAIEAINANYIDGTNGFNVEIENFGACFGTHDFLEGTSAFLEKRKAEFK